MAEKVTKKQTKFPTPKCLSGLKVNETVNGPIIGLVTQFWDFLLAWGHRTTVSVEPCKIVP